MDSWKTLAMALTLIAIAACGGGTDSAGGASAKDDRNAPCDPHSLVPCSGELTCVGLGPEDFTCIGHCMPGDPSQACEGRETCYDLGDVGFCIPPLEGCAGTGGGLIGGGACEFDASCGDDTDRRIACDGTTCACEVDDVTTATFPQESGYDCSFDSYDFPVEWTTICGFET